MWVTGGQLLTSFWTAVYCDSRHLIIGSDSFKVQA